MIEIDNPARTRMATGGLALGVGLRSARGVEIAMAMKTAGFDFLFIDLEHGAMSLDTATQIACAALGVGISPLVRVPEGAHSMASRALDGGALGIVMPHVETAEEARQIVARQKFPPLGPRSMYASYGHVGFKIESIDELEPVLEEALAIKNKLVFVDVMVDPKEHVYPMLVSPNGSMRDMWLRKGVRT